MSPVLTRLLGLSTVTLLFGISLWRAVGSSEITLAEPFPVSKRLNVLILTGISNPAHDWQSTTLQLERIFGDTQRWDVEVDSDPEHAILATDRMESFDVVVMNFTRTSRWKPEVERGFQQFLQAGKGAVVVHAANNSFRDWPDFEQMVGAAWRAGSFHPPYGPFLVHAKKPEHPIMNGVERFEVTDELYSNLRDYPEHMDLLAFAMGPDQRRGGPPTIQPIIWTTNAHGGRVFHLTLGHDARAMQNPYFVMLLQRGTSWAGAALEETGPAIAEAQ